MAFRQMHYARKMLESLGVVCSSFRQREADDCVMGAVRVLTARKERCVVVSSDKDLWQAVHFGARVWCLGKKVWLDQDNFEDTAGVPPSLYVLYKALVGDPSDSIKGATGCGSTRAAKLLEEAEGLEVPLSQVWPPRAQLSDVFSYITAKSKPQKFELEMLADYERLADEIEGIDMSESFGGRGIMVQLLERSPKVAPLKLIQRARRFGLPEASSITRFADPFVWAGVRRDGKRRKKRLDRVERVK